MHIHRKHGFDQFFIDLPSIEAVLSSQPVFYPGVQLTQSGKTIDAASYADENNCILPLRLFEHYAKGATIVLSQAQKLFPPLHALCCDVMRTMKMRSQANVYLSPPGHQGFNAHYDTHDVFIIQVSGKKRFNFYPSSVQLPCPEDSFDALRLESREIDESIDLVAGDTLYIPRGVVHDAIANSSSPSIHITVGMYPVLMRDMLQEVIQFVSESDDRFRMSIDSYTSASTGEHPNALQEALSVLVSDVQAYLQKPETIQRVQGRFHDELALNARQDCVGLSAIIDGTGFRDGQLPAFERISLCRSRVINHEIMTDRVKIRTFGQVLEFHGTIGLVVEKLVVTGELRVSDMQKFEQTQREALVKQLLLENLVELFPGKH